MSCSCRRGESGVLDVRATMELDKGAVIYTTYGGVVDLGPNGYNLFLQGILPPRPFCLNNPADP